MPKITTEKIGTTNLDDPILFDGESGQTLKLSSHQSLSELDMTINLQKASSVIQYFVSDIKNRDTPYERVRLERNDETEYYHNFATITDNFFNLMMIKHWKGLDLGEHTFKIRSKDYEATYRNSKHIVLVLRT